MTGVFLNEYVLIEILKHHASWKVTKLRFSLYLT